MHRTHRSPAPSFPRRAALAAVAAAAATLCAPAIAADTVEVIHWWTSAGETAAVGKFKEAATARGIEWKDLAGETMQLVADGAAACVFDPVSERRITL